MGEYRKQQTQINILNSTMKFRPCIDLHEGKVKQIVGKTLTADAVDKPETNFISDHSAVYFADMFYRDGLTGGHVIMLGPNNEQAATEALQAFPNAFHIGGGVSLENAQFWLEKGAKAVIISSRLFNGTDFSMESLQAFTDLIGKDKIILDLSCRLVEGRFRAMTNKWNTVTNLIVDEKKIDELSTHCAEFLIHAVEIEGTGSGPDWELLNMLARCESSIITYAGGISSLNDLAAMQKLDAQHIDFTIGSALNIYGGHLSYATVTSSYA